MKLRSTCLYVFFFCLSYSSFSQEDASKALLQRTAMGLHKVQKQMIASNNPNVGGKFAKAVLLQSYAVKLYKDNKRAQSACASLQARQFAFAILKEISEKKRTNPVATDEEKKLAGNCSTEELALKEGKKVMKNISDKDGDYSEPRSLNATNIDIQ